jgi:hypothetical protein
MPPRTDGRGVRAFAVAVRLPRRATAYESTSSRNFSQCRGCGTLAPARMREQAASDKLVAAAISASVKASSFGAISRLNQASSRRPGCSRAQRRLRRCPSLIVLPRARFTEALRRESSANAGSVLRAPYAPARFAQPGGRHEIPEYSQAPLASEEPRFVLDLQPMMQLHCNE